MQVCMCMSLFLIENPYFCCFEVGLMQGFIQDFCPGCVVSLPGNEARTEHAQTTGNVFISDTCLFDHELLLALDL